MNYPQEPLTARVPEYQNTEIAIPDTYQNKYSVQVETLDVGFFLKVGCQNIAVATRQDLVKFLSSYFLDTQRVQEEYRNSDKTYESLLAITN